MCRIFFELDLRIFRGYSESCEVYIYMKQVVKSLNYLHSQSDASHVNMLGFVGSGFVLVCFFALMEVEIRMRKTEILATSLLHFEYSEQVF